MKLPAVLLLGFIAVVTAKYTSKYDNIDLDEILNNDRLYMKYYDCLMDKGNCTPDGKELKKNIPDAIATDCSKCSDKQKSGTEKVLKHMLAHKKADYEELEKIYDPSGSYKKKHPL